MAALAVSLLPTLGGAAPIAAGDRSLQNCEKAVASSLRSCLGRWSRTVGQAYRRGEVTHYDWISPDIGLSRIRQRAAAKLNAKCGAPGALQALGFGGSMTPSSLADRLVLQCSDAVGSLAARSYGGPHGVVRSGASTAEDRGCLDAAYSGAARLLAEAYGLQSACIRKHHRGGSCKVGEVQEKLQRKRDRLVGSLSSKCRNATVESLIGLTEIDFTDRALAQARCLVAGVHPDTEPLALDCGPRAAVPVPPRGQWVQITLEESQWGTRCGDGSPYSFWLRLAPEGAPVERVVVFLQGGFVCIFESECVQRMSNNPALFRADDDWLPDGPTGGILSTDSAENPFADWTMLALPYCTQDVYMGPGVTNVFPSITVHRYGGRNLRVALRYLRDVLWKVMDMTTADGYRADRVRVLFGGESAGGFGVSYNYHYLLDDLRWVHTMALPDSALGLDNGTPFSVRALGAFAQGPASNGGWETRSLQPPYCLSSDCAVVVPTLQLATSQRLGIYADQVILNLSNQVDEIQRETTLFVDMPSWTNTLRQAYCSTRGAPGVFFFLPAVPSSQHTMLDSFMFYSPLFQFPPTAGGVTLRDYLATAVTNPSGIGDRVDEGSLTTFVAGVLPFPCALP